VEIDIILMGFYYSLFKKNFQEPYYLFMIWPIKRKKLKIMKKQSQLEKTALKFALRIIHLVNSFPDEEKFLGFEMARDAVKVSSGISTFIHLNEVDEGFRFLNEAFSATFRIEVYLLASKDLGFAESIEESTEALKNLQNRLDEMLNRVPGLSEI